MLEFVYLLLLNIFSDVEVYTIIQPYIDYFWRAENIKKNSIRYINETGTYICILYSCFHNE